MAIRITDLVLETQLDNDDTIVLVKDGKARRTRVKDINTEQLKFVNSNYSLQELDGLILCDASTGAINIQLPNALNSIGKQYGFRKTDNSSNEVTIICQQGQLIDANLSSRKLSVKDDTIFIMGNQNGWFTISEKSLESSPASGLVVLKNQIDQEILDRISDVNAEELRAVLAETALSGSISELYQTVSGEITNAINIFDTKINIIQGPDTVSGSISYAVKAEADRAIAEENSIRQYVASGDIATLASANSYTDASILSILNSAPEIFDTLGEIAIALQEEQNATSAMMLSISNEVSRATSAENLLDSRLDIIEGTESTSGSILFSVKAETDRAILAENALDVRLDIIEGDSNTTGSILYAVKLETDRALGVENLLDSRLDIIEGSDATTGSIAFAVKAEADRAIAAENSLQSQFTSVNNFINRNTWSLLQSDVSNSTTSLSDAGTLSLSLLANSIYKIEAQVIFQLSSNADGITLSHVAPNDASANANWFMSSSQISFTYDSAVVSSGASEKNTNIQALATFWVSTTLAGTFKIQFASKTPGNAVTLKAGSIIYAQRLS